MDANTLTFGFKAVNNILSMLEDAKDLLPDGKQKREIELEVKRVERAIRQANCETAGKLDFHLCKCTFPPQVMLFDKTRNVYKCPNESCGLEIP